MSGLQFNSIASAGTAAAASVASSLIPKRHTNLASPAVTQKDDSSSASTSSTASAGDITSSDFLTLLVSELKNQDPTQPTDPNAYITQLVGVNSLQQLISINSGLTSIETPSTTTT
jgi:flagellar basal-body rod modification protein FlgD